MKAGKIGATEAAWPAKKMRLTMLNGKLRAGIFTLSSSACSDDTTNALNMKEEGTKLIDLNMLKR